MTKKPSLKLPPRLSALLRLAVCDAIWAETQPGVSLDMMSWVCRDSDHECHVCMAGSMMLRRGNGEESPSCFNNETCRRLRAVDMMRMGDFVMLAAGPRWGARVPRLSGEVAREHLEALQEAARIVDCGWRGGDVGRAPWSTYLEAAEILEKAGL